MCARRTDKFHEVTLRRNGLTREMDFGQVLAVTFGEHTPTFVDFISLLQFAAVSAPVKVYRL